MRPTRQPTPPRPRPTPRPTRSRTRRSNDLTRRPPAPGPPLLRCVAGAGEAGDNALQKAAQLDCFLARQCASDQRLDGLRLVQLAECLAARDAEGDNAPTPISRVRLAVDVAALLEPGQHSPHRLFRHV